MANCSRPGNQFSIVKDRDNIHHVRHLDVSNKRIVVSKDIAGTNPWIIFVIVANHPLDEPAHRVDMHHNPEREDDAIALGGIQANNTLSHLADSRRCRDALGGLASGDNRRTKSGM